MVRWLVALGAVPFGGCASEVPEDEGANYQPCANDEECDYGQVCALSAGIAGDLGVPQTKRCYTACEDDSVSCSDLDGLSGFCYDCQASADRGGICTRGYCSGR